MWVPDPRWEEPNLLIPGKKPVGPVQVDWSHPLAEGLLHYYMPVMGMHLSVLGGGTWMPDLAGDLPAELAETVTSREMLAKITDGAVTTLPESLGNAEYELRFLGGATVDFTVDEPWTVMNRVRGLTSRKQQSPFCNSFSSTALWNRPGSYFRYRNSSGVGTDMSSMSTPPGAVQTTMAASSGSGASASEVTAYQHETDEFRSATGLSTNMSFSSVSGYQNADDKYWEVMAMWRRCLSRAEMKAFCANPYQVLIPA